MLIVSFPVYFWMALDSPYDRLFPFFSCPFFSKILKLLFPAPLPIFPEVPDIAGYPLFIFLFIEGIPPS